MASARPPYAVVNLANAFLGGSWTLRSLVHRGKQACRVDAKWVRIIVRRLLSAFGTPPSFEDLLAFLLKNIDPSSIVYLGIGRLYCNPRPMAPLGAQAETWNVPAIASIGQLADWLGVSPRQLDWLADIRGLNRKEASERLRHYVCRWQPRRRGRFRLVESPKPQLKIIQRKILHEILDRIPPHSAVHGFRADRSILTYAAPHVGQRIVLGFDLRNFFPTVATSRVHALFRTAGYPREVARLLTGLCTSLIPAEVWDNRPDPRESDAQLGDRLLGRHLPQGAPTSPALANLCAHRLDIRLSGLAQSLQAVYTRYADDLAFSGGKLLEKSARRFQVVVAVIAAEEGFDLHFQKSRFMRQGVCQQLAGVVVNRHVNVRRAVYDELKAILTNCLRHGHQTQNRAAHPDFRSHLLGRIAHVQMIHPQRGAKLRAMFNKITW